MVEEETFEVEVVLALPDEQFHRCVKLAHGATLADAARASGLLPAQEPCLPALGVFGRRMPADHAVRNGDRVEIYRQLGIDPKDARRRRAQATGD